MAVTSTPAYPQSAATELWQLTVSDGVAETGNVVSGTTNGKAVKEMRIHSKSTGPREGSKLLVTVHDGTNSRIVQVITLAGGSYQLQAQVFFANLFLPSSSYRVRLQMTETLPASAELDFVFMSEVY
jgi:hypothetical protein